MQLLKDVLTLLTTDADADNDDASSCTSSDSGGEESADEESAPVSEVGNTGSQMDTADTQIPVDVLSGSASQESLVSKKVLPPVPKISWDLAPPQHHPSQARELDAQV